VDANGAGVDFIQFNIPITDPGFVTASGADCDETNNGLPDASACWWRISLLSPLPALTDSGTEIRGSTQPGDTNPGLVGTIINVGVDEEPLTQKSRPEVAIDANGFDGLTVDGNASGIVIQGLSIYDAATAIVVTSGATSHPVASIGNILVGVLADGSDPGTNERNTGSGIEVQNLAQVAVINAYVGFNGGGGIVGAGNESVVHALFNEVFENGWNASDRSGIELNGIDSEAEFNYSHHNRNGSGTQSRAGGHGISLSSQFAGTADSNLVENNTLVGNISAGVAIRDGATGNTIQKNVVTQNAVGVLVSIESATRTNNNVISQNSIFVNAPPSGSGGLGIDLQATAAATPVFDGVTRNDQNDSDAGSNNLTNFPILATAHIEDGNLNLIGFAEPGTLIEVFLSDVDSSGFGEGAVFVIAMTEGSAIDTAGGTGSYGPTVNGQAVSNGSITANRFAFSLPLASLPVNITEGTVLTATGTVASNTSEFGPNVTVALELGSLSGFVFEDRDNDGIRDGNEDGIDDVTIHLTGTDDQGNAVDRVTQTNNNGKYEFNDLRPGVYEITEEQPADFADGLESRGTLGGVTGSDRFSGILVGTGDHGTDYNFAELTKLPPTSAIHTFRIFPETDQRVQVQLLSAPGFDPLDIDVNTVRLGNARVNKSRDGKDVNRDGQRDLALFFKANETGLTLGATTVRLQGQFKNGRVFALDLDIQSLAFIGIKIRKKVK
jgi:parallel beta-helix repeat protein